MTEYDKKVREKIEANRQLIRQNFSFLTTEYGYREDFNLTEGNIYSQVIYAKNNWKISLTTISYNRQLSLKLLSPQEQAGFLDYYFNGLDKDYDRNIKSIRTLDEDINYKSKFLRMSGQIILEADPIKLQAILDNTISKHNAGIKGNIL